MEEVNIKTQSAWVNQANMSNDAESIVELGLCSESWNSVMINPVSELSAKAMEIIARTISTVERRLFCKLVRIHVQ